MKKNIFIKQILATGSVKKDLATGVMNENSLTVAKTEDKIQPIDEFRFSQRCYCGLN